MRIDGREAYHIIYTLPMPLFVSIKITGEADGDPYCSVHRVARQYQYCAYSLTSSTHSCKDKRS